MAPFDNLRKGQQLAKDSISLDYNSLPPQLVFGKALKRRHLLLAALCAMSLLANVFAIALSSLFFEKIVDHELPAFFSQPFELHFNSLNGSAKPFISQSSEFANIAPFYIAVSNISAKTHMPAWSDEEWAYLPVIPNPNDVNGTWQYRARTPAVKGFLS